MDCLFCKIVNREIPSNVVYETEDVMAFYDIAPQAPVHVVIIPKQHIASPADITAENCDIAGKMFLAALRCEIPPPRFLVEDKHPCRRRVWAVCDHGSILGACVFMLPRHGIEKLKGVEEEASIRQ